MEEGGVVDEIAARVGETPVELLLLLLLLLIENESLPRGRGGGRRPGFRLLGAGELAVDEGAGEEVTSLPATMAQNDVFETVDCCCC